MLATTKVGRAKLFIELMTQAFKNEPDYISKLEHLITVLNDMNFFTAPASANHHGNYEGGLFDHSYKMTLTLLEFTKSLNLTWSRPESPYIIGMCHDLCKCDNYVLNSETNTYEYSNNLILPGHGEKSVILAQKLFSLTEEEIICIRWHMGAYDDKSNWDTLGKAIEKYPNVLYTHTADMAVSKIIGV